MTLDDDPTLVGPSAAYYTHERYAAGRASRSRAAYYAVKPLLPRHVQLALRRAYAHRQMRREFPAWPIEPVLADAMRTAFASALSRQGGRRLPFVSFWPDGRRFAAVLTHDVEGPEGIRNIPRLLEIEQHHGFVSSWNFCAEWYPIPRTVFDDLRGAGCEIGLHGIKHDGRLFQSRACFERDLPNIHRYLAEWGAAGFRSPATLRNAAWIHELGAEYDSSFPDTDPFEPQGGGCCSILPFFFGDVVELPITLVQDHTLFEILRRRDIELWTTKARWIAEQHGLVNLIVHPDYMQSRERLLLYDEFLAFLRSLEDGWHALPRDVARWWRRRARSRCVTRDGSVVVDGPAADDAHVSWAYHDGQEVVLDG